MPYLDNPINVKCSHCGDLLTEGQIHTNSYFAKGVDWSCYQCSQKELEQAKKRYESQTKQNNSNMGD